MTNSLMNVVFALPVFALVLFRITGLLISAPLFASTLMPVRVRIGLALALAMLVFPLVVRQAPSDLTFSQAILGGFGELVIGVAIGLGVMLLVSTVEVTGLILGQQAGMSLGEVFNPTLEEQTSVVAQVYSVSFMVLFLLAGGHRAAVVAVLDTFQRIPLLAFRFDESLLELLIELLSSVFILGLRLAGPVLLALFLTECALALVSRTMPQLNILTIGFATRALLAIGLAALVISLSTQTLLDAMTDSFDFIRATLGLPPSNRGWVI
ncbi:MAG: flagellar biosynthetic protein FliR [Planctomycetota bacterium]